jgi:4-amino-4-deoxy-L-arabinose transferase-like glycosyltransferase
MAGQIPYRDFYFDQAPLLPYVFGLALGPFHYDEVAARLFAIACTLLTLLVTFAAAARLGGRLAGLLAFLLLLTNFDFLTELSAGVESNGSFTALVVALVGLALAYRRLGLALALGVVAAGLRQLFIPLPVVVACYVVLVHRRPWLALLGGLIPLAALYGAFLVLGGESALLGMVRPIRSPYVVRVTADLSPLATVASFRDMLLAVLPAYLPFFLYAGPAAYLVARRGHRCSPLLMALVVANLLILLANILPYPNNPYYPITQLPLAAIVGAVSVVALLERAPSPSLRASLFGTVGFLLVAAPLLAYRSPEYIDQFQGRPPLARFLAASEFLKQVAPPGAVLVTLETPFATQTGMRLPHGLEAGSWGVYRGITPERARALGVVTYPMLVDMVEQGVGDVVIESDRYGFLKNYMNNDTERDRLQRALADKYVLKETFGNLSDWGDVRLYTRKS